jgi:hypothetical protein
VRDRVNLIREHLAGVPYARLPVSANLRKAAKVLSYRLRKSPEWATLEQVLQETL